jgi:hypothetical protein
MQINENTRNKLTEALQKDWPRVSAEVAQLEFEGAQWIDEGTHIALMVWNQDNENEVVAATLAFDADGNLGELEECFGGMNDLILDGGI